MYEQFIAQAIINRIKQLIIAAFAQLDGQEGDDFSELYLTLENNKKEIERISGLSAEVIDKITALIGEKIAATIGFALLYSHANDQTNSKARSNSKQTTYNKRETAQKILQGQLLSIIANKVEQEYDNNHTTTLAELKLANIISSSLLKKILENKNISIQTTVYLDKIQSIIKTSIGDFVKLISNNGQVPNQAVKIPRQSNIIERLSSELNIMSSGSHKGIGSELISSPDFTPHVNKDTGRGR